MYEYWEKQKSKQNYRNKTNRNRTERKEPGLRKYHIYEPLPSRRETNEPNCITHCKKQSCSCGKKEKSVYCSISTNTPCSDKFINESSCQQIYINTNYNDDINKPSTSKQYRNDTNNDMKELAGTNQPSTSKYRAGPMNNKYYFNDSSESDMSRYSNK